MLRVECERYNEERRNGEGGGVTDVSNNCLQPIIRKAS
jgi:hypothetical protein